MSVNETKNTSRATTQTSGSATQTQSTSQTPAPSGSHPTPLGPILGGTLGGLFVLGLIIVGIWLCNRHKRRRQARPHNPEPDILDPEFTVDPFIDHFPSGRRAETPQSQPVLEKLLPTSTLAQHSPIVDASAATDTDTWVPGATTPNTLPTSNEPRIGPITGFTTDELVVELNQRIQTEDEQWNENETLPEYPGSNRGSK
ncbi:hypothetical protein V5O48_008771 [Marasmius crinis-equi]|uniref:Uncharacterized protein n=1 Tax=Marasmius crinis-equi TaxID=585013 RepID=A0ABR3FDG6_9AGAR